MGKSTIFLDRFIEVNGSWLPYLCKRWRDIPLGIKGGNWKSPNRLGSENRRGVNGRFSIMFDYRGIRTRKKSRDSLMEFEWNFEHLKLEHILWWFYGIIMGEWI